ncbi:cellulose binding domain-containing protein [Amycolatopsis australiensis]|uniref:Cellulose binding domain-containing protein n=1 Tax=Amycolatopsis australiensis TaxID=546364 RepID=A0A1K1QYP2_9PSEU|nr:cellulose binding domain-containing protein [Amycolatopsis australiensis]SFW64992.1 Cellulose binding domain-containing protein [Amycolatopsis australiensis]
MGSASRRAAARPAVLAAVATLVLGLCVGWAWPSAATPAETMTGNATHFDALGAPYGGCGLPQAVLDSPDFVALNVYNTPGDYSFYPRPLPPSQAGKIGLWDNGRNCGRFVRVTIGDYCTGTNDGAPGQPFCRNGSWVADGYDGAELTMVVADSCGDANAWCRDDPGHLDLATDSLNRFVKNGVPVGDMNPAHWNNRRISWSFVAAPAYTGDLKFGFLQGAQRYWTAIAVSHLPNGVHGVEYLDASGTWQQAQPNSDMGQSFLIGPTTTAGTSYAVRVRDAADTLVNNGRVYRFSLPDQCLSGCAAAYTPVTYTTDGGTATTTPPATTTTSAPPAGASCAATTAVTGSWNGGHQLDVTVRNTGSVPLTGWATSFSFAGSQRVSSSWNAVVTQSGQQVRAANQSYNGTLAPGATTTWGAVVTGDAQPLTGLTCTT